MEEKPNNEYFIIYSNSFYFYGILLSFRKKQLFNISNIPTLIKFNDKAGCWIINRKQLTLKKAEELITKTKIKKDLSDLQWNIQINLDKVFNLD